MVIRKIFFLSTKRTKNSCYDLHDILMALPRLQIFAIHISAETQSGLPLLPWSCYASVIQWDIIQYLMFLFYYNTGIISFLTIYNDTILCPIICVRERLYAKKQCFSHVMMLHFYFGCFVNMFALMFMNEICCIWL